MLGSHPALRSRDDESIIRFRHGCPPTETKRTDKLIRVTQLTKHILIFMNTKIRAEIIDQNEFLSSCVGFAES